MNLTSPTIEDIRKLIEKKEQSSSCFSKNCPHILKILIFIKIAILAFLLRLFSIVKFEAIIHEFDPWFNLRSTEYLINEGIKKFFNWYDIQSWYPLGRSIGSTVYPGMMSITSFLYWMLLKIRIVIPVEQFCIFIPPFFGSLSTFATYFLVKEITHHKSSGLISAFFMGIAPAFIGKSVAGSFDNDSFAIFSLILTLYFWVKSLNTKSILFSSLCAFSFFYLSATWGGYILIINIIPFFSLCRILMNDASKIYVSYTIFYLLGTILIIQIPSIGFNALASCEHLLSHIVFIYLQISIFFHQYSIYFKSFCKCNLIIRKLKVFIVLLGITLLFALYYLEIINLGDRSKYLINFYLFKSDHPIVDSIDEHIPSSYSLFFLCFHYMILLMPIGMYNCLSTKNCAKHFLGISFLITLYFSSRMTRMIIMLAPFACSIAGIGYSFCMRRFSFAIRYLFSDSEEKEKLESKNKKKPSLPGELAFILAGLMIIGCIHIVIHCTFYSSEVFSNTDVVLSSGRGTNRILVDDFREAYLWLKMNSKENSRILAWWDYGYQINGFANRTTFIDNNTGNYTHIASIGKILLANEEDSYNMCKLLGVDYVLVIFGGIAGFPNDDISKFFWIVKITEKVYTGINEADYYKFGHFSIGQNISDSMKNSLIYKLSYYKTWDYEMNNTKTNGFDFVRGEEIGHQNYNLKFFTEAYTSDRWIVRIYKVNDEIQKEVINEFSTLDNLSISEGMIREFPVIDKKSLY